MFNNNTIDEVGSWCYKVGGIGEASIMAERGVHGNPVCDHNQSKHRTDTVSGILTNPILIELGENGGESREKLSI